MKKKSKKIKKEKVEDIVLNHDYQKGWHQITKTGYNYTPYDGNTAASGTCLIPQRNYQKEYETLKIRYEELEKIFEKVFKWKMNKDS